MVRERLRHLVPPVLLIAGLLFARYAAAQALPTATGPGSSVRIGGGVADYHIQYGQRWLGGAQGWVDANTFWRFGIEAEGRWLRYNQDLGTHETTYLIGPRVSLLPSPVEPYIKLLAGSAHFAFPYNYARGNYLVVAGGAGVDLHVGQRLQIRVIDIEYQQLPKFTFGTASSYGVSAGISYTVHRGASWYVH